MVNDRLFPGVTYATMAAEAERELASRRRTYPDRVAGGRMTQAAADYQIAIMAGILDDTRRMSNSPVRPEPVEGPKHKFSWLDRRKALDRELAMRTRFYPGWIGGGRLTQANADRQLAAMNAILWRYDGGFDWPHADLTGPDRRAAWHPHWQTAAPRWCPTEAAQAAMI